MPFHPADTVAVDLLADGRVRTREPLRWTGKYGDQVDIEPGTESDGATRPRLTAAIVDQWGGGTRAFLIHDELCNRLRAHRLAQVAWWTVERFNRQAERTGHGLITVGPVKPPPPTFSAVDTDGAFRKILGELGVPDVLRWLYWVGVRWGALFNPARRAGWWRTAVPVLLLSLLYAVPVLVAGIAAAVAAFYLWAAQVFAGWKWGWLLIIGGTVAFNWFVFSPRTAGLNLLMWLCAGAAAQNITARRRIGWLFAAGWVALYAVYLVVTW